MPTYPPAGLSYTDPLLTASRYLQTPNFVAHRVATLADQRYVGSRLLPGRQETSGGAVGYEQVESIFAGAAPEVVSPGSEYTMTTVADGPAGLAKVVKSGKDTLVTDEAVKRRNMDPVEKGQRKLANSVGAAIDAGVISLIASSITQTRAAKQKWDGSGTAPSILQDILRAVADIRANNQGYDPDVLLVDDSTWAYMASDTTIAAAMAREDKSNTIYDGRFDRLSGLEVVHTSIANMPGGVGTAAFVLDTRQLGFIATEDLGGGYQQAGDLIQTKVMRVEQNDAWRLRARANFAPVVTDPGAGFKITTVA